jgi:hypothetical protein
VVGDGGLGTTHDRIIARRRRTPTGELELSG